MEGGRGAGSAGDGDEIDGTRSRSSGYLEQHGQSRIHILEPGPLEGDRRAGSEVDRDEIEVNRSR